MWDGKDHPVTSPPGQEMTVAVKRINDHTSDVTVKQNGKVMEGYGYDSPSYPRMAKP
jgi:hypothetical protein